MDPAAADRRRLPFSRIDAHQHFWDIESGAYAWPTPSEGAIYRTFTPGDLRPEIESAGIDGTVLVQTVDTLQDTDAMLAMSDRHTFIRGVVGWVPLEDMAALEAALAERTHPRLIGIRHLIHQEPNPDWLIGEDVRSGLATIARLGLPFDVVAVFPMHLELVPVVADRHPDLVLIIDHLAKPPYRAPGWDEWLRQLRAAATRPRVFAKLSGLDTAAGDRWTAAELRPAIDAALEAFGPDRLLFGSDWPVCRQVSTYLEVVESTERAIHRLSAHERAAIMGGNATRVYGLR